MNASRVLWRARGRPPPASPCSRPYHASFMKALAPLQSAHAGITCCLARQAAVLTDAASLGSGTQQVPAPPQLSLTHQSLQAMIDGHGMQATLIRDASLSIKDPGAVKSLVFIIEGKPLLVVLLGADKVDFRKVAEHMGVKRSSLRMATQKEALGITGFRIGTIPPLVHLHQLRTLVDTAVTVFSRVIGGGGASDVHLVLDVPDLLHFAQAEVVNLAVRPETPTAAPDSTAHGTTTRAQLPLPWPAGSKAVRMAGMVVKKHRIAKRLMFVSVVPVSSPELPTRVQASHLRRVWRNPDDPVGPPIEVQLIMGKTIEQALGQAACEQLLGSIRVGSVVFVSGVCQDHLAPRSVPSDSAGAGGDSSEDDGPFHDTAPSTAHPRQVQVLDVVCHRVSAVFETRRAMQQAVDECDMPAADRELLKWQLSQDTGLDMADAQMDDAACGEPAPAASTSTPSLRAPSWQLPLPSSAICVVDTLEKLAVARSHLLGDAEGAAASGKVTVIGIDCEWQPQERGKEKYPVALMQLAVKDRVFLLDLQTLCNKGSTAALPPAHSARQRHQQQRRSQAVSSSAAPDQAEPLTHEQIATGQFIQDLFSAGHVLKLGFSLVSDLDRLAESYPWMTQFPGCLMTNQSGAQASSQHSQPFCSSEEFGTLRGEAETLTGEVASTSQSHREAYLAKILASDRRIRGARCCLDLATVAQAASGTLRQARRSAWALRLRQSDSRAAGGAWLDPAAASSLSGLTNAVLGVPLDKGQQRSQWATRPLSAEQLHYAAADAYVLLSILNAVLETEAPAAPAPSAAARALFEVMRADFGGPELCSTVCVVKAYA